MRYRAVAFDYDGTVATDGRLDAETFAALKRCRESGRKLILVTGRELDELIETCPELPVFDRVVAENGALLYEPATREEKPLADAPSAEFVAALRERGAERVSVGRVIVATWEPWEQIVLQTIRDFGLELQVIFNKGAVMVLPTGVNKATGLAAALEALGLSTHNVVAIGDAENDHALMACCEAAVAVANAVPLLKERADLVTNADHGRGVAEMIDLLLQDDLEQLESRLTRHHLLLGKREDGSEARLRPFRCNALVAGTSGGGKSTLATALIERLAEANYQFAVIDPEGDYGELPGAVSLGNNQQPPNVDEVLQLLKSARQNVVVNLIGLPLEDRPTAFVTILSRLAELRNHTGRPHWIIVDEAHHVLPASWEPSRLALPTHLDRLLLVTLEPNLIAKAALDVIDTVFCVGQEPQDTLRIFCETVDCAIPPTNVKKMQPGEVLYWEKGSAEPPFKMKVIPAHVQMRRHSRKYAEGELEPDRSFFFRGSEGKLKLRAQNLVTFLQLADGIDDDTWQFHLQNHDYSRWFRDCIKDDALGDAAAALEKVSEQTPAESREQIKRLIAENYTLPGGAESVAREKKS